MTEPVFTNEPPIDFSFLEEQEKFANAIKDVREEVQAGKLDANILIGGAEIPNRSTLQSVNPSNPQEVLGEVSLATKEDAKRAIELLLQGQSDWAAKGFEYRAKLLNKIADMMRQDRYRLAAIIVLEAGKPWAEADGDVCEAIDFCEYYAMIARALDDPLHMMPELLGELNHLSYAPRGLTVVIAPWNFPLAILCGMTVASLVTGNSTIAKPAEQTSIIAHEFAKIVLEAGVPEDAFAFLPGEGESVGRYLVHASETKLICFTGSKQVGLEILKATSEIQNGQHHIKRAILELGGKNALIIDNDADYDDAVKGAVYSAFGFAGQKCSACSRLIIVGDAYELVLERLIQATGDIFVGPAEKPETFVGPLIDKTSQNRVIQTIEMAKENATLAFSGEAPSNGYFVAPTIFRDVSSGHSLWKEEVFAPVLAVKQAEDFETALALANDSQYALTGGVFSRSPKNLELAKQRFSVGNLYLNRGITGAIVGRQPFGGFRLSGIGSKAGGPDYLLQFLEPRTVSENTMRKGFTPELAN